MRMERVSVIAAVCGAFAALAPGRAEACGGCFLPPSGEVTVVTGHRMAIAVSTTQSVLWDQIQYTGDPADFAWILPVTDGARVEESTDAWFEVLEAATRVEVFPPQLACSGGGGFGCGCEEGLAAGGATRGAADQGGVQVLHEGTVGPYETVTLRSTVPGALYQWLQSHDYAVDEITRPVIDAYVTEGFDFIALRLQPGMGVRQMKPVRVIYPGASLTFPLRMVAAGTGDRTALTVFVVGEGRWQVEDFPSIVLDPAALVWDFNNARSNYTELRDQALDSNEGRTWLTTYAKEGALLSPVLDPVRGSYVTYGVGRFTGGVGGTSSGESFGSRTPVTIAEAYLEQGLSNGEEDDRVYGCASELDRFAASDSLVVDPCAGMDGGCRSLGEDEIDVRQLECGALDDVVVALLGMHPRGVWVGRLEADLPRAGLGLDLALTAADEQTEVQNILQARQARNAPCDVAITGAVANGREPPSPPDGAGPFALLIGIFALTFASLRRLVRPASAYP